MAMSMLNSASGRNNLLKLNGLARVYQEEFGPSHSLAKLLLSLILYEPLCAVLL